MPYVITPGRAPGERDDPRADRVAAPYETQYRILRGYSAGQGGGPVAEDGAAYEARPARRRR